MEWPCCWNPWMNVFLAVYFSVPQTGWCFWFKNAGSIASLFWRCSSCFLYYMFQSTGYWHSKQCLHYPQFKTEEIFMSNRSNCSIYFTSILRFTHQNLIFVCHLTASKSEKHTVSVLAFLYVFHPNICLVHLMVSVIGVTRNCLQCGIYLKRNWKVLMLHCLLYQSH